MVVTIVWDIFPIVPKPEGFHFEPILGIFEFDPQRPPSFIGSWESIGPQAPPNATWDPQEIASLLKGLTIGRLLGPAAFLAGGVGTLSFAMIGGIMAGSMVRGFHEATRVRRVAWKKIFQVAKMGPKNHVKNGGHLLLIAGYCWLSILPKK